MRTLKDYYGARAEEITSQFKAISILQHALERGLQNEEILRDFLRNYMPNIFSVGSGFVMPTADLQTKIELSKQLDILIYNSADFAAIFKVQNFFIVREETAAAVVEVKTRLSSKAFDEALENIASIKMINGDIQGHIFAFQKEIGERAILNRLQRASERYSRFNLPDSICVLDGDFFRRVGTAIFKVGNGGYQLALFHYNLLSRLAEWLGRRDISEMYDISDFPHQHFF